ncbi:MAG: GerMN domain-containing protein [Desulfobacterales bacterium]
MRKAFSLLVMAVAVVTIAVVTAVLSNHRHPVGKAVPVSRETAPVLPVGKRDAGESPGIVYVYFIDKDNANLKAEARHIRPGDDPVSRGVDIINHLIAGPRSDLQPSVSEKARLNAFFVNDGAAYVDLSEEVKTHHPGGAVAEHLSIYSIVNSLVLNIAEIDAVTILINGREAKTLAGHIDLRYPFFANMLLIE